jgi:LysM repeat protein
MNNNSISDPYVVKAGDTLSAIAKRSGRNVGDLKRFNQLSNPNRLDVGQTLYLSEQTAFGITTLFLDALRYPIENLRYQLRFDGKTVQGITDATGKTLRQITNDAKSTIEVWICNLEGQWQQVGQTVSGYGHKLLTAVSPYLVVPGTTERHPSGAPLKPEVPAMPSPAPLPPGTQAPKPKAPSGTPTKNNEAAKTKPAKGAQGQPLLKIEIDIPQGLIDLFRNYKEQKLTEADWDKAAQDLECEVAVLKAISKVECGEVAFRRINGRSDSATAPAILYERHFFHRLTNGKYSEAHPDISWKAPYAGYGDFAVSYLRLINAYRLDEDAALRSCSWGRFQILGDNFKLCDAKSVKDLVAGMCTSEYKQLGYLSFFIQNKPRPWKDPRNKQLGKEISLWEAAKTKNWQAIAFNYNGPTYKKNDYDNKLKNAYEYYKRA